MEDKNSSFENLIESAEEYSKTTFEILKLRAIDRTSGVASTFVSRLVAVTIIFMFLLIGSLGIAYWLGDMLGKEWYGFFIVAGFYGITGFILYFFMHKWLKKRVGNSIIKQVLK
jgi:hypothetical protein